MKTLREETQVEREQLCQCGGVLDFGTDGLGRLVTRCLRGRRCPVTRGEPLVVRVAGYPTGPMLGFYGE